MFLLEHAKKTATKSIKEKKNLWEIATLFTETLLKRIKRRFTGAMTFPLFFTSFSNISFWMEPMNNYHLSQNILSQICVLYIAIF